MWTAFDAKLVSILIISASTFLLGILPACIGLGTRCQRSVILSAILCFGGGVLLATSLVHILPETRISLSRWAEIIFCLGFFTIYLMDVILQVLYSFQERNSTVQEEQSLLNDPSPSYETMNKAEEQPHNTRKHRHSIGSGTRTSQWTFSNYGLLVAFSVHSLLEGLVVGVQTTPNGVLLLLGAICCHKLVVAFCLGAELSSDGRPLHYIIPLISVYVVGSAVGIAIGMFLQSGSEPEMNITVPVLQALAGGTLMYIVLSEILPRERTRDLPRTSCIVQFLSLLIGFIFMVFLSVYL